MRSQNDLAEAIAAAEFVPNDYFAELDLGAVFSKTQPVEVDLGCGDGSFIVEMAAQNPERNFLGIERLLGRVRSASHKIAHRRLTNARVIRIETSYAIRDLLQPKSIDRFHLMFPDPWPKRRHQNRRIVSRDFLESAHRALKSNGILRITTDQHEYAREIQRLVGETKLFSETPNDDEAIPSSAFQRRFADLGTQIHRLVLRRL